MTIVFQELHFTKFVSITSRQEGEIKREIKRTDRLNCGKSTAGTLQGKYCIMNIAVHGCQVANQEIANQATSMLAHLIGK